MKNTILWICRIAVGLLFIFSGLITSHLNFILFLFLCFDNLNLIHWMCYPMLILEIYPPFSLELQLAWLYKLLVSR